MTSKNDLFPLLTKTKQNLKAEFYVFPKRSIGSDAGKCLVTAIISKVTLFPFVFFEILILWILTMHFLGSN